METISFQNYTLPAIYVTGLSYSKSARLHTSSTGFARFLGFNPAEISLRLYVDAARAMVSERDFLTDFYAIQGMQVRGDAEPEQVIFAGNILYPALEFRITAITTTTEMDASGIPVAIEADVSLSGVRCTKGEAGRKALVFSEDYTIPQLTITCGEKSLSIGVEVTIAGFVMTPEAVEAELLIGDDLSIASDKGWLLDLARNEATLSVDGYGDFYIISADLAEGVLSLKSSRWPKQKEETEVYTGVSLNTVLREISGLYADVSGAVGYYLRKGTELQAIADLQRSAGFLIDYAPSGTTFRAVPDAIVPDVDMDLYIDSDLATEQITGIVWRSPDALYTVGSNPSMQVESAFSSGTEAAARSCLKYMQYMQNSISITTVIDTRIKHHSAIYVIKDSQAIPCMVENYVFDFMAGTLELELHYVSR